MNQYHKQLVDWFYSQAADAERRWPGMRTKVQALFRNNRDPDEAECLALVNEIYPPAAPAPSRTDELRERALSVLTGQQQLLFEYLWERGTARFDTLSSLPGVWRDEGGGSDEAIERRVKEIRKRLADANILNVDIAVRGKRVNLSRRLKAGT